MRTSLGVVGDFPDVVAADTFLGSSPQRLGIRDYLGSNPPMFPLEDGQFDMPSYSTDPLAPHGPRFPFEGLCLIHSPRHQLPVPRHSKESGPPLP